jgi:hypothetical protein
MSDTLTLHEIHDGLRFASDDYEAALAVKAEADAAGTVEDRADADAEVARTKEVLDAYLKEEVRKVDNVAGYVRWCVSMEKTAKEEADRVAARAKSWKARVERIKEMTLYAMQAFGVTHLETATNRLRRQNNSQASVVIDDEAAVPRRFKLAEVVMPAEVWLEVLVYFRERVNLGLAESAIDQELRQAAVTLVPSKAKLGAALKRDEAVLGARLVRGEHLRIE